MEYSSWMASSGDSHLMPYCAGSLPKFCRITIFPRMAPMVGRMAGPPGNGGSQKCALAPGAVFLLTRR